MTTLANTTALQGANHAAVVDAIYATMVATYGLTVVDAGKVQKAKDAYGIVTKESGKSGSHRETLMIETAAAAVSGSWEASMIAEAAARMMSTYSASDKTVANIVRQMSKVADPKVRGHLANMFATARAAFGTDDAKLKEAFLKAHGHVFGAVISGYVPCALKGEAFPVNADEAHAFAARKNAAALTPAQCAAKVKKAWELLGEVPMISAELRTAIATLGNIKAASFVAAIASAKKLDEVRTEQTFVATAEQNKIATAKLAAEATREANIAKATNATLAAAEVQKTAAEASLADSSKLDAMLAALTSLVPAVQTLQTEMVALKTKKTRAPKKTA